MTRIATHPDRSIARRRRVSTIEFATKLNVAAARAVLGEAVGRERRTIDDVDLVVTCSRTTAGNVTIVVTCDGNAVPGLPDLAACMRCEWVNSTLHIDVCDRGDDQLLARAAIDESSRATFAQVPLLERLGIPGGTYHPLNASVQFNTNC